MKKNKASSTAYTVVHGVLHTAKNPELTYLVGSENIVACKQILQGSKEGRERLNQLNTPIKSKFLPFLEWLLMPGITLNYVLRKKFIEEKVLKAIQNGVTQVVNIGAGFDTLLLRLSSLYPSVTFIEIDHPATSDEKTKAFTIKDSTKNLFFISADLSKTSLVELLQKSDKFDSEDKTLYICEGVLMYLQKADVSSLFDSLRQLTGKGSIFIFSCMEPFNSEKNNIRPLLYLYLKFKKEDYLWYMSDTQLPAFVKKHNYTLLEIADSETYRKKYLHKDYSQTLHKGEYFVVAKVD